MLIQGCYFHGCSCLDEKKWHFTAAERQPKFELKIKTLQEYGTVYIMKECEWTKLKSSITKPTTGLGHLFEEDTEETLLEGVRNNRLFGFLVADVDVDDSKIEEFVKNGFLFPPCTTRKELSMDHLSPYMHQRYTEERKAPKLTVIQSYRGSQILIMTAMANFLMENDFVIKNVTQFIQYQPGKALAPFVKKVTSMRIQAARDGDDAKGMISKLIGNSGKFSKQKRYKI